MGWSIVIPHLFRSFVFEVRMLSVDESCFGVNIRKQMVFSQLLVFLNLFINQVTDVLLKFGYIFQLIMSNI